MKKVFITIFLASLLLFSQNTVNAQNEELFYRAAGTPSNPKVQASWNKYYTYAGVVDFCTRLSKAYPELVTMEAAGKSFQGRDILVLTISDKYNDTYRWVPLNGDIAGLCVRTDSQRDPWFSPAGLSRGVIKNVVKLSWNPTKTERDEIYKVGVNPVVTFPGEGTILYGDKTLLSRPSAFDRINVRRLFIVLEKSIAKAARSSLFEFNDEFTRAAFVNLVEPFLRDVQGRPL